MGNFFKYFKGATIFWAAGIVLAFFFLGGIKAAILVTILAVLEVSLSFDNAVVNAKQLGTMDAVWQGRFLTWGMVIAVFGMRVLFPLLIVSSTAQVTPWDAAIMAVNEPLKYAAALTSAHILIAGLGTAFLGMVTFKFFFAKDKEVHWIGFLESKLHHLEATEVAATMALLGVLAMYLNTQTEVLQFLGAGMVGIALHELVEWVGGLIEEDGGQDAAVAVAKAGLGAFVYLEILDASFSFDGVIGAFAITTNIFIITLGLGTGAFAVRGLTLMLVEKGTLSEYKYLEHSAFYAIGALAVMMGISTFHEIPEIVTGGIGAALIGLGYLSSMWVGSDDLDDCDGVCASCACTEVDCMQGSPVIIRNIVQTSIRGDCNLSIGNVNG